MAILDRLSLLLRANVHAAIDKAEDPEKLLEQLIRDADAGRQAGCGSPPGSHTTASPFLASRRASTATASRGSRAGRTCDTRLWC